jgi:serine/threonine protein kinase
VKVKVALEIVAQVAAGLAAVLEQNLVHRDIKPSNIMVRLKDDGTLRAKIIDLGLAKSLNEPGDQSAISTPGAFAGTPEFASPEQFAGVQVDIRSDLYSLGITLWEMLTGNAPFQGTPGEVMHQHQHVPIPLEHLEDVPQPVVILLEVLLEKDPGRRFQDPGELLKAIPTITRRIEAGRRITREALHEIPPAASRAGTRKPPARQGPKKISIARLPVTRSELFGRAGAPRPPMNFSMRLSLGLATQIHGSEQHGRRAKDWPSSSLIAEPYWFWTGWSRCKIRRVPKKDGCVSLPSRRCCANSPPSIQGFA